MPFIVLLRECPCNSWHCGVTSQSDIIIIIVLSHSLTSMCNYNSNQLMAIVEHLLVFPIAAAGCWRQQRVVGGSERRVEQGQVLRLPVRQRDRQQRDDIVSARLDVRQDRHEDVHRYRRESQAQPTISDRRLIRMTYLYILYRCVTTTGIVRP